MTASVLAPAKINLTLHVTGRRADGYHLLDSLVIFGGAADRVTVATADHLSLEITGPEAAGLGSEADNLVLRAARWLDPAITGRITLHKVLPVASGIGGGSADAAAALRGLCEVHARGLPDPSETADIGADVPVCLAGRPARMHGVGEELSPVPPLPAFEIVLVNPRVPVATAAVFAGLARADNAPMPTTLHGWPDLESLCEWLGGMRNDLADPARVLAPAIDECLAALRATGAMFARMSGSGATCFGIYAPGHGEMGRARIAAAQPGWWVAAGPVS